MNVQPITIQTFVSGAWHSAASIRFPVAGVTQVTYLNDYLEQHIESFGASDEHAICEAYPLDFEVWKAKDWPAFILDIMPSGAARRWWKRQLSVQDKTEREFDFELLRDYTSSPIGHLRVLESVREYVEPIAFSKDEVVLRDTAFLEYAAELGVALGGATGAGGDAPKVLLVEDAQGYVYPEGALLDKDVVKSWLVKWPRGKNSPRDRLVLRTEHLYSKVLADLGFDILPGELFDPEDGKPCVWFPRFDRNPKRP